MNVYFVYPCQPFKVVQVNNLMEIISLHFRSNVIGSGERSYRNENQVFDILCDSWAVVVLPIYKKNLSLNLDGLMIYSMRVAHSLGKGVYVVQSNLTFTRINDLYQQKIASSPPLPVVFQMQ